MSRSTGVRLRPVQSQETPAKGMFLVAAKDLRDPNFVRTVVLLVQYGEEGAVGLVLNHPTDVGLSEAFPGMEEEPGNMIHIGGPVARDQIMFLIRPDVPEARTVHVLEDIFFTGDMSAVMSLAGTAGAEIRAYSGYAGWAPGQLDAELARGDWILVEGNPSDVFASAPEGLWGRLIQSLNLKSVLRSNDGGTAKWKQGAQTS